VICNLLFLSGCPILISGCAWFGIQSDTGIPTISAPPEKISESDAAMPVVVPPDAQNSKAKKELNKPNRPRVQEERDNGVVNQIRVNNKNLPSYYIYPTQQQPNYDYNRIPDENISTPNWQISW
jgi:hypothetical protein